MIKGTFIEPLIIIINILFIVNIAPCQLGIPTLISPSPHEILDNSCYYWDANKGESVRTDIIEWNFKWSEVSGATYYNLYVHGGENAIFPVYDNYLTSLSYLFKQIGPYIANQNRLDWYWRVRACNWIQDDEISGHWEYGPWSEMRFFNVEKLNTDCPLLEYDFELLATDTIVNEDILFYVNSFQRRPDADENTIFSIEWNWGDGIVEKSLLNDYDLFRVEAIHSFQQPGEYWVCLRIQDNDGLFGAVCKKIIIKKPPEKWHVELLPIKIEVKMGDPYTVKLRIKNESTIKQTFNFKSYFKDDIFNANGNWPLNDRSGPIRTDFSVYGQEQSIEIEAGETRELKCIMVHQWDWIRRWELPQIISDIGVPTGIQMLEAIKDMGVLLSQIAKGVSAFYEIQGLLDDYFMMMNKRTVLFFVEGPDIDGVLTSTINVKVPEEKYALLVTAYGYATNVKLTIGLCLAVCALPLPQIKIACIPVMVMAALGIMPAYNIRAMAVDPSNDFTELTSPREIQIPAIDTLQNSPEKELAQLSLKMATISESAFLSYAKYLGAKTAERSDWAAVQKAATMQYIEQIHSIGELQSSKINGLLEHIPTPTEQELEQMRTYLRTNSFQNYAKEVLNTFGFGSIEIDGLLQSITNVDDYSLSNFNELPAINETMLLANNLLIAETDSLFQDSLSTKIEIIPDTLIILKNNKWLTLSIELPPKYDVQNINLSSLKINGIVSCDTSFSIIGDMDNNGQFDLQVRFDNVKVYNSLNENKRALSLTGLLIDSTAIGGIASLILQNITSVELCSFNSELKDKEVIIKWTTMTEYNISGYILDGSIDNVQFNKISFIKSKEIPTGTNEYEYKINSPTNDKYYFKLSQLDKDGNLKYLGAIETLIKPPQIIRLFECHPNPFNNSTVIEYQLPFDSDVTIEIFNLMGQLIKNILTNSQEAGQYKAQWDGTNNRMERVSTGTYLVKMKCKDFIKYSKVSYIR